MHFIKRLLEQPLRHVLSQGKSVLLLGPRQTGKTTLLEHQVKADITYSFLEATVRRRFELEPDDLIRELKAERRLNPRKKLLTVVIDEVQKVPAIMDTVQYAIDHQLAQFVLTGSSARKLRRDHGDINLLPGRIIELHMEAFSILEMKKILPDLGDLLLNGSLPEIILQTDTKVKEQLLTSYVNTYLEEEIRSEALVRNLAGFSRFLSYAAIEAGNTININNLSKEIGVSRNTINEYFQILDDCLIADRIEPLTRITTRRRLTKTPKYLFFDLGVRRVAAGEGIQLPEKYYGDLFEQFIGIELLKVIRAEFPQAKLRYWKDHNGPEVDYVIEYNRQYFPIEVKYTQKPSKEDARHLLVFLQEYDCVKPALVVCRSVRAIEIAEDVIAISWKVLPALVQKMLS